MAHAHARTHACMSECFPDNPSHGECVHNSGGPELKINLTSFQRLLSVHWRVSGFSPTSRKKKKKCLCILQHVSGQACASVARS